MRPTRLTHRPLVIGLCALIAFACAVASVSHITLLPPKISKRNLDVATASARISVDLARPMLTDARAEDSGYEAMHRRSVLVGEIISSQPALDLIARRAGLDPNSIAVVSRVTTGVQRVFTEPDSERRAMQIAMADRPLRLEVQPDETLPILNLYAQGPSIGEAVRLANAVAPTMQAYLDALARREGLAPAKDLRLDQLGPARGGIANGGAALQIALLTFVFVFAVCALLALAAARWRRSRSTPRAGPPRRDRECVAPVAGGAVTGARARSDDWPHTARAMPWLIAALMAIVFLVPFNDIELAVSLPIDVQFDRLVLAIVFGVWVLLIAAGGTHAPKLRMTWIHVALGAVAGIAVLSIVVQARALNQSLEFDLAIRKLTLLAAYVGLFVIVASVVRRSEVRAFMTYTLGLALLCAAGTIVEYRFQYNAFYSLSDALLPAIFAVTPIQTGGVDEIGRLAIQGPGQLPLEVAAMMSMALPIALVRLVEHDGSRIVYALAAAVLLAATVATFRKTAFLAPVSIGLTLAYFRRRELIRLAPLGVVLVLLVQAISPGALMAVVTQLDRDRLGVTTVSDRTADYDAIRPDVWSHLALGRGYGSYEHTSYRVLDMELLRQLIEVGVVGLAAYVLLALAIIAVARGPIRARDPADSPVALAAAAAAVCFLVVSMLFDVMSFPHVPYILLWLAALLAVTVAESPRRSPAPVSELTAPAAPSSDTRTTRTTRTTREHVWSS